MPLLLDTMAARARELSGVVARRRILLKNDLRYHAAQEADMVSCDAVLASGSRSAKQGEVPAAGPARIFAASTRSRTESKMALP